MRTTWRVTMDIRKPRGNPGLSRNNSYELKREPLATNADLLRLLMPFVWSILGSNLPEVFTLGLITHTFCALNQQFVAGLLLCWELRRLSYHDFPFRAMKNPNRES